MLKTLSKSVREYAKHTKLTLFFITLEVILECLMPFIMANLVNGILTGVDIGHILGQGGIMLLMACLSLACGGIAGFTSSKASCGFARNLRNDMFEKIQSYSFENIDRFSSSSLVTRMTTDVHNMQHSYLILIRTAVRSPLMFLFSIIMSFASGGVVAMLFVVIIPILVFGLLAIAKKAMPSFRRVFKKYDKLNESIEENVMSMRTVKGFVREEYEEDKFDEAAEDICRDFTRAERIVAINGPLMRLCMNISLIGIMVFGSQMIINSFGVDMQVGQLSSLLTYGVQILMSLMMLSMVYVIFTMSAESAKRIVEVLKEEPTIVSPENAVKEVADGSVRFENVSFEYKAGSGRYALSDIDFSVRSGEVVGVLGGTGSGKTSLIQLISRLYDATQGKVYVGGVDVRDYDTEVLRNQVAVVLQKNELFAGTIAENLRWGNKEATDEELVEACELAQAHGFITSFPDGYETRIEQGGTNVSGGQKQRLCIARALLKRPKILILDDSTSAVDTKTDALIREGFRRFIPDTTKIIIAQRVASVQDADRIIVLDKGAVSAMGTHDELLEKSEIYREIYEQQTKGGAQIDE